MAKRTITRKKGGNKTEMKGDPLRPNERAMERGASEVESMVTKMHRDFAGAMNALFSSNLAKEYTAQDASITSRATAILNKKTKEWSKKFDKFSSSWSDSMVKKSGVEATKDLNNSLKTLSGGATINTSTISERTRDIAKASAEQSTSLIKTIADDYMSSAKESVMRSIVDSSNSFTSLKDAIQKGLAGKYKTQKNKAKNTALDQTRKSYQAISTQKMKDAGLDKFEWVHTGGSKSPRNYHKNVLDGQIFSLDNPPVINQNTGEKGLPGDEINCKCIKRPVVSFG